MLEQKSAQCSSCGWLHPYYFCPELSTRRPKQYLRLCIQGRGGRLIDKSFLCHATAAAAAAAPAMAAAADAITYFVLTMSK